LVVLVIVVFPSLRFGGYPGGRRQRSARHVEVSREAGRLDRPARCRDRAKTFDGLVPFPSASGHRMPW
jgi:hypothetical protein